MRTTVLALAILAVAAASVYPTERKIADKDYLLKQKKILQLFVRVHQPNMFLDLKAIGDNYDIAANLDHYNDAKVVKEFLAMYKTGLLPRGEVFSVLYQPHMEQAIKIFDVFYAAKDWDTLLKTACWARDRVNEAQFVYALTVALLHRQDTHDVVLPPIYEITPHFFVDSQTIQKAYQARMEAVGVETNDVHTVVIPTNQTSIWWNVNPEQQLSYFTEDVGLNAYHTYFHLMYPFWLTAKNYGLNLDRYGELFYYTQQQLLARYNFERLSVGLPEVDILLFNKPIKTGYTSGLRYKNGLEIPTRPDNVEIQNEDFVRVEQIEDVESRLRDAVDLGYVIAEDGSKVSIYEKNGVDILGNQIATIGQSLNYRYYKTLYYLLKSLVGRVVDPIHRHDVAPGTLENFMTSLRDPVYYSMCRRIDIIFQKYKEVLGQYTYDELAFPGVRIENVEVDKLVTYFENFDIDLLNAINVNNIEEAQKLNIVARQQRLTNKPFTYKVVVSSEREANVMVRVFIGPKYDITGQEFDLDTVRKYMVELDRFPFKVVSGRTVIVRNSHDSAVFAKDPFTYQTLVNRVEDGILGKRTLHVDEIVNKCGFPERLLLPRGQVNGLPVTFFVMVTPYDGPVQEFPRAFASCGVGYNAQYPDMKPMGYPFDRVIKDYDFVTPNMFWKDVLIFHKKTSDVNFHN
ncbi:hexamerin [Anabrus simplex]|uniref:hexamerin n=1 Tax=Anabrus simplex TaxID=316456 RepID=UPI0035A33483